MQVAQRMANEATNILRRTYSDIPISIEAVKEPDSVASGTGCGLMYVNSLFVFTLVLNYFYFNLNYCIYYINDLVSDNYV